MAMYVVISIILCVTIVLLSLLPGNVWIVRVTPAPLQKLLHILFYAALATSLLTLFPFADTNPRIAVSIIWIGAIGLGATLEWLQGFLPGRISRVADVARNAAGATIGVAIWLAMRQ